MNATSIEVTPREVDEMLKGNNPPLLVDVRMPWEYDICHIGASRLVPLNQLPNGVATMERTQPIVVYCHHGVRSLLAAQYLRQEGFEAMSMSGGIDQWARQIEPDMARY
jgi:sulfur-carrier protein adenylyltransferase/sulfurtransferase